MGTRESPVTALRAKRWQRKGRLGQLVGRPRGGPALASGLAAREGLQPWGVGAAGMACIRGETQRCSVHGLARGGLA